MGYNWRRLLWVNFIDVRHVEIREKTFRMFVDVINVVSSIVIVAEVLLVLDAVLLIRKQPILGISVNYKKIYMWNIAID